MTAEPLRIEAPTDAQLSYIASLCREQGWPHPAAVHSKIEASAIIGALRTSTYRAEDFEPPGPIYDDDDEREPDYGDGLAYDDELPFT